MRSQPAFYKRLFPVAERVYAKWCAEARYPAKHLELRVGGVPPRPRATVVLEGLGERVRRWHAYPLKLRFFRLLKLVEADAVGPPPPAGLVAYRALAEHLQKLRHERRL